MKKTYAYVVSGLAAATLLIGGVVFAQSATFSNEMGVGAQSSDVTNLQTWLENNGYYSGPVTGYYGSLTMAGVENFQSQNGISATGYVGPLTLAALNAKASGSVSTNSSTLAQLQAELSSLLAQIQALESQTTTTSVPTGASISVQTNENASTNGALSASGTGPFTYSLSSNPTHGTIASFNPSTGTFTYTPNSNYAGSDTFTYTVSNSSGVSSPMTITVNVQSSTTGAPIGQALSFSTANSLAYNGTLSASGNSPYTFTITSSPSNGSISNFNSSTGTFTYTPNSNSTGNDSFTYTVSNSAGVSSPVTVTISNNGSNSTGAPTGQSLSFTTTSGAEVNGTLAASGNGPFTYTIVSNPSHGTINVFNSLTGAFSYFPTSGFTGTDSFSYQVSNSSGTSATYTVNITVN